MSGKNRIIRYLSNVYAPGMSHIMCYPWSSYRFSDILVDAPNKKLHMSLDYYVLHNQVILSNKPNTNFLTQFKELGEYIYMDLSHVKKYNNDVISPATMLSVPFIELNKSIFLYANTMKYFTNQETKRMTIDYYLTTSVCEPYPFKRSTPYNPLFKHQTSNKLNNEIHVPCIPLDIQNIEDPQLTIHQNNEKIDTFTLQKNEGILYTSSCYKSFFDPTVLIDKNKTGRFKYLSAVAKIVDH